MYPYLCHISPDTLLYMALIKACTKARWCVTYSDLQFLHDEVADSIFDGAIDVEEEELTYGPSIYKVNETLGCGSWGRCGIDRQR